jgi:Mn-dependent DtxR family transcriptional regulator
MDVIEHKIITILKDEDEDITISEIAKKVGIDRHTAAKRLDVLKSQGLAEYRIIGKSKVWKISKNPFITALNNDDTIINNFKDILKSVDDHVNIQSKDLKTIWTNKNISKHKCYEVAGNECKCKNCPIEKTFRTGKSESAVVDWNNKKVKILTKPIFDNNNRTVAVVEIVKKLRAG